MVCFLSRIATVLIFLTAAAHARAEVLFEGYSKITAANVHIGYTVLRYEYDAKKKQFTAISYLKTGALGEDNSEGFKAVADQDLNPISYEYTALTGKKTKTIDAKFSKGKMTALIQEGGVKKTIRKDLEKGTFASCFLIYKILKSKSGLQTGINHAYSAVAEEDAEVTKGKALVEKEEIINGAHSLHILNTFKDLQFTSNVTDRGEVLSTRVPATGIAIDLVAKPNDAVGNFGLSTSILKNLFGEVPLGVNNVLSKAAKEEAMKPAKASKQEGVPAGEGIEIKQTVPGPTSAPTPAPAEKTGK